MSILIYLAYVIVYQGSDVIFVIHGQIFLGVVANVVEYTGMGIKLIGINLFIILILRAAIELYGIGLDRVFLHNE